MILCWRLAAQTQRLVREEVPEEQVALVPSDTLAGTAETAKQAETAAAAAAVALEVAELEATVPVPRAGQQHLCNLALLAALEATVASAFLVWLVQYMAGGAVAAVLMTVEAAARAVLLMLSGGRQQRQQGGCHRFQCYLTNSRQ